LKILLFTFVLDFANSVWLDGSYDGLPFLG
jgi:hypothetical protein